MMTRTSTIPVTVCSDERPDVAAVGMGDGISEGGGGGRATDAATRDHISSICPPQRADNIARSLVFEVSFFLVQAMPQPYSNF